MKNRSKSQEQEHVPGTAGFTGTHPGTPHRNGCARFGYRALSVFCSRVPKKIYKSKDIGKETVTSVKHAYSRVRVFSGTGNRWRVL